MSKELKEKILSLRNKVPTQDYEIPGVGKVKIYGFTGLEKSQWQDAIRDPKGNVVTNKVDPLMFISCVRDESGKQIFTLADELQVRDLPCQLISQVCTICMKLSGIGIWADQEILRNLLKNVENEEKSEGSS